MHTIHQLLNLPKITLADLLHKNQANKKQINPQRLQPIRTNNKKQPPNLLDVKTPFYVDRFQNHKHNQCSQGKCLACRYSILKPFEIKAKKDFLKSSRTKWTEIATNRVQSQRMSEEAPTFFMPNSKRFRSSEGYDNIDISRLKEAIRLGLQSLDQEAKQNFYKKTNKKCEDSLIADLCLNYVRNSTKLSKKLGKNDILSDITNFDIQEFFDEQFFIKYIKSAVAKQKQLSTNLNRKVIQILNPSLKKRKSFEQQCSIKLIEPQEPEKKPRNKRKNNTNVPRKKVQIAETQSDINQLITETRLMCSQYFISTSLELNDEVKQKLNEIANKKYKRFKGAVSTIDGYLQEQVTQNPDQHEILTKKLQIATDWMKTCIPDSDKHEDLKLNQLDKLVTSILGLAKNVHRKGSLKKNSKNQAQLALSKFQDEKNEENQIEKKTHSRKSMSKSHSRRTSTYLKQQIINGSQLTIENSISSSHSNKNSNKRSKTLQDNTEKLIKQESYDNYGNGQEQKCHLNEKKQKKKSDTKPVKQSFLKNSKDFHPDQKLALINCEATQPLSNFSENVKKLSSKEQEILEMQNLFAQIERIHQSQQNELKVMKENKKKLYLKIRAAQLLKQNQDIIEKAEKHLRDLNLCNYIINTTDCVLTQKKKIRHLRQIIRVRSLSRQIEQKVLNQIIRYLFIYEQNCQILMEKFSYVPPHDNSHECDLNLKSLVSKRQIYNELLFYDLKKDFHFGKADDEQINYSLLVKSKTDKSWQISTKNIPAPYIGYKVQKKLEKQKAMADDLVQKQMSDIAQHKLCGVAIMKIKKAIGSHQCKKAAEIEERFLVTENA